jgi:hypothetical protein
MIYDMISHELALYHREAALGVHTMDAVSRDLIELDHVKTAMSD